MPTNWERVKGALPISSPAPGKPVALVSPFGLLMKPVGSVISLACGKPAAWSEAARAVRATRLAEAGTGADVDVDVDEKMDEEVADVAGIERLTAWPAEL